MNRLVLAPLKKELNSLVSVLNGAVKNEYGFSYKDTQLVVGGLGSSNFKSSVLKYKEIFNPKEIIAVGSCGALKSFKPQEVVEVVSAFKRDPQTQEVLSSEFRSDHRLFESVSPAVCVSGDGNVLDQESKVKLLEEDLFDIVTWETYAFFKIMKDFKGISFTELRVVTDFADENGFKDFSKNLSLGMQKIGLLLK